MNRKVIREINRIIMEDVGKRLNSVWDLEQRAKSILNEGQGGDFYKGFLRAIEMLRERGLLKERPVSEEDFPVED